MEHFVKTVSLIFTLVLALGALSLMSSAYTMLTTPQERTILTAPLEHLESHGHNISRGDSLRSHGHVEDVQSDVELVEQGFWITGMEIVSINAPQLVIHHMHLFNRGATDPYCAVLPEFIMDIGQDAISIGHFPPGYGMYVPKGAKLFVNAALHNPQKPLGTGEEYENVSVGFRLFIDRFGSLKGLKPLTLHIVSLGDDMLCNETMFTVPPRTTHYIKSSVPPETGSGSTFVVRQSGTIIAMGAHVHAWEGGESLEVFKNGERIALFVPEKTATAPETWRTKPDFTKMRVEPGDVLTTRATYSNPYEVPITGAMGMAAFFINYDED